MNYFVKKINYKKIIILVDEHIQSFLECLTMALQTSPNVFTLGDTSAAAHDYIKQIYLSGNILFTFTAVAGFYPNEKTNHRSFVRIDYPVRQKEFVNNLMIDEAIKKMLK